MAIENLDAAHIPLVGKHLIEASAGTGKTYNITRIYLRLLLERELTVEQILLMTFTKDATQELRGRIDQFIRQALTHWPQLCQTDSYFAAINARVSADKVQFLLKRALLFLDEAAIFTLHGFCQRALSQHAFASGLPFNANLTTSSAELVLEACQDWYRQLAKSNADNFSLVAQFWPQPSHFIRSFGRAISHNSELLTRDSQQIVSQFIDLAQQASKALSDNDALLQTGLLSHKKAEETAIRVQALAELHTWLANLITCTDAASLLTAIQRPMPDYLLNANRHPKAYKQPLAEVLAATKVIKAQVKNLSKKINKANAYQLVQTAIYHIRAQVKDKKTQQNILDFDDLIGSLATTLTVKTTDNSLACTLFAQYPVALVDEFQDTDPEQFSILQAIYYSEQDNLNNAALYLIGDPKQAIYGFRGGDIFAYLMARHRCEHHWLMDTNYRSTPDMVHAYNQMFVSEKGQADDAVFGYQIPYQSVQAGKPATLAVDAGKAMQFIHFSQPGEDKLSLQYACPLMATWCANEIIHLLTESSPQTRVKPHDIAILVRDSREAQFIKQALQNAGLASVFLSDRANLFHSEQAKQLLMLLQGILGAENDRLFLAAITCGLLGFDAPKLQQLQQDELAFQTLKFAFMDYKQQWQQQGFIAMAIHLMHQHMQVPVANKARILTNLLHLFEILQQASQRFLQPEELLYWFEQQCLLDNINSELEAEQRLESDGNLIRIITQHGAKGLEYPVVFIPFACKHKDPLKFGNQNISYLEYHDQQGQLLLSLDGDEQAKQAMANEAYAETIRLLYVAITRAEQRCYVFCAPFANYHLSPLGKTLQWQAATEITTGLQQLIAKAPEVMSLTAVTLDTMTTQVFTSADSTCAAPQALQVSKFIGKIERDWWLSSFSALTKNLRHGGVSIPDRDDGTKGLASIFTVDFSTTSGNLLRFSLAKGAHSGNLLHDILEHTDFSQPRWQDTIKWPLVKYGELATPFTELDLSHWLDEVLKSPLANAPTCSASTFCLADLAPDKTLREIEFYFPLAQANMKSLAKLLTDHRNADVNEQNRAFTLAVKLPYYQSLKGMMHGFIDLVFEHQGKYYLADYKSTHLGDHFTDYHQRALRLDIEKNHYDLQYLIYSVALHRYLRLNLKNYQAETHFGGIYYLYLRGMTDDKAHAGAGVYYRHITPTELAQLDKLFAGDRQTQVLEQ